MDTIERTRQSRGRRVAFRAIAGLLGVLGFLGSIPFTVTSFVDDAEAIHRMHNVAFTALNAVVLSVGLLASAWRPEVHRSAFLVAAASGIAGAIAGLASGDFISGVWYTAPISIVVLWALHPSRAELLRPSGIDAATAALSLLALTPAIAYLLTQAALQRDGVALDPHWEFHHYSGMAAAALALPLCGLAASLRVSGRRLGTWLVGTAGLVLGGGSLALSDHVGAFERLWAWLALAWGLAIVALAELGRGRGEVRP